MGDFYGTVIEIWAGCGPVWQLLRPIFSCFHGQIFFLKHCEIDVLLGGSIHMARHGNLNKFSFGASHKYSLKDKTVALKV